MTASQSRAARIAHSSFLIGLMALMLNGCVSNKPLLVRACAFHPWLDYQGTKILRHASETAYLFTSTHVAIDADGAPNAYHPDDTGLDYLANAGYPNESWWPDVLVPDPQNPSRPFVQKSGAFRGYFVSATSLHDKSKPLTNPERYADARHVPYLVFPGGFYGIKGTGKMGDLGIAIHRGSGKWSPFVVADIGMAGAPLGEMSIALAEALGGVNPNPRNGTGAPREVIDYVVFPYSALEPAWPMSLTELSRTAEAHLARIGGIIAVKRCMAKFSQ